MNSDKFEKNEITSCSKNSVWVFHLEKSKDRCCNCCGGMQFKFQA